MKKNFLLATATAALFAFSSCKKDNAGSPAPNNPVATKQLKKITRTENGITTVFNFIYDANKRLTSYKSTNNNEYVLFSYDANGNLARVEEKNNDFRNIYTYTYINNVPSTATFKSWELTAGEPDALHEDNILTYTVSNNQVSKIKLHLLRHDTEINLLLSYTNGNLTRVTTEGADTYTASFTFGNKKPVFPKVTNWVLDHSGFSLQFSCNNEMLSMAYDFPGTEADHTETAAYTYDADGYVLTSNDGSARLVFEYQ